MKIESNLMNSSKYYHRKLQLRIDNCNYNSKNKINTSHNSNLTH